MDKNPCAEILLDWADYLLLSEEYEAEKMRARYVEAVSVRPDWDRVVSRVDSTSPGVEPYFDRPFVQRHSK